MTVIPSSNRVRGVYDLAVIGAGSAGFSAAITAAEQGARVALIGHGTIGGTCVNVGCVPSKTMIRAAETLYQANAASRFSGIAGQAKITDWDKLIAAKNNLVTDLRQKKYIDLLPEYESITYIQGWAKLCEGGVMVDGDFLQSSKTIIATGSSSMVPPIVGIDDVAHLDSTMALELDALPKSLLIIGGGVIGCELGQMFARCGVKVTICCRNRLLPSMEKEISAGLQSVLEEEGISVYVGLDYQEIEQNQTGITLIGKSNSRQHQIRAEKLLLATGRRANTESMALEENGVEVLENGGIKIDEYMRSTNPDIYAAGDVTGTDMFVYMAAYGAKLAARNAMGKAEVYDNSAMAQIVFTDPQIAMVGLGELAARQQGYEVKTSIIGLDNVPRALAARDTRGLIKLVVDSKTDILLGAHIMAPEGADSIQTAALAIKHGMTSAELGATIFPYLTTVEGLKLAAQGFGKDVDKLSCCAG